jgi:hypothetical protein
MQEHSKFGEYHWKSLCASAFLAGASFMSGFVLCTVENHRQEKIRNEPIHQKYLILENAYRDLATKQQQLYSITEDQEVRQDFSKLVEVASNTWAKAELSRPEDVKKDYQQKMESGLFNKIGNYLGFGFLAGAAATILLGATYPLTMAGDAIYQRRKRNRKYEMEEKLRTELKGKK